MACDHTWVQGDTAPDLSDNLSFSNGQAVDLTGATVVLTMRQLTSAAPLTLTGSVTVTNPDLGSVLFSPSAQDTSVPGIYAASWQVTWANGRVMTFPTDGYLSLLVQENLVTAGGQQLVSVGDAKDYLNIPPGDRSHDAKLVRFIEAVRPAIENIAGPIIPQSFDEIHDGGQSYIRLRRRPSTALGTSPILTLTTVEEWRGPSKYSLAIVTDPGAATTYSVMLDTRSGQVTRRTTGGGVIGFPSMSQSVHVVYTAGQQSVPSNVYEATLELIRVNYQTTQSTGRGMFTQADGLDTGPALGFFVPRRVRELLAPNRRAPAIS